MRRADLNLPERELIAWVEKLLFLLPANIRKGRRFGGATYLALLPGTNDKAGHRSFLKALWARLVGGGRAAPEANEAIHLFFVAIERVASQMSNEAKAKLLVWLRDSDQLPRLLELVEHVRSPGRAIDLLTWIFFRQHGAGASERISFATLQRLVPGFAPPFDLDAVRRFQDLCESAFRRKSDFDRGQELFEKAAASETLGKFQRLEPDLNKINTSGRKKAGEGPWKFPGRDYRCKGKGEGEAKGNFRIFDLIVRGPGNRMQIASCADGQMAYLIGKLRILCKPSTRKFDQAVEELRFVAREDVSDLGPLASMSQEAARKEVALRSVLLVHPDSVVPLRAVVASMEPEKLNKLLDEFMALRGLDDREKALGDLLASIQPGVDLD